MTKSKLVASVYHPGILVSDMERSLVFYRDLLGLKMISDNRASGKQVDAGFGLKNVQLRLVYLRAGNTEVELIQFYSPSSKPLSADAKPNDIGVGHVAFVVPDVDKAYGKLFEKGIEFLSKPQTNADGTKWVYLRDPDGTIIEFVQLPGE